MSFAKANRKLASDLDAEEAVRLLTAALIAPGGLLGTGASQATMR